MKELFVIATLGFAVHFGIKEQVGVLDMCQRNTLL